MVFLHQVETLGFVVGHIHVIAVCEVSVVLPAVSECDLPMVLSSFLEAVQDFGWEWVSLVCFVEQFL